VPKEPTNNAMAETAFKWPGVTERLSIFGRTGSGKTQMGAFILSQAPFDRQPYVIIDYKHEGLFGELPRIREIGLDEIPTKPGLYIVHPLPKVDDESVEDFFHNIWTAGDIGIYIDELHMLPDKGGLQAILTQGRSKRIPVIALSQRPAWVNRFIFSESEHFAIFHLHDKRDREKLNAVLPDGVLDERQPEYHSVWYRVKDDKLFRLAPVETADKILARLDERLAPNYHVY
jgi:hypothetical protein